MLVLATAAAGVLSSILANIPNEFVKHYINRIWEDDKDIVDLRKKLDEQFKLLDSKKKLTAGHHILSRSPPDWLDQLEKCLYDIEDIQECKNEKQMNKIVADFLTTYIQVTSNEPEKEAQPEEAGKDSKTQDSDNLFSSREAYKSDIIEELTSRETRIFGVSIIGMGGIGKTVLARFIASETIINNYFHTKSPLKSPNFSLEKALAHIESLPRCKVLILLDGVHQVKPEDWRNFRSRCENLHPESKVLITTQNPQVANVTGTSKYFLPPPLGDECFSFIYNIANENNNLNEDDEHAIKHNKEELVDSCKGLPLLASQIGILLSATAIGERRKKIIELTKRTSWEVQDLKRVLLNLEVVSLLAHEPTLRRCLAFFSLFPPDYEFEQDDLVQFWMAGFTLPSANGTWMESTFLEYFDHLHSCSLFQTPASLLGQQPRYKLHRLFYDMALSLASKTFYRIHNLKTTTFPTLDFTRHVSLSCENSSNIDVDELLNKLVRSCRSLRTFLLVNESGKNIKDPNFLKKLTRLRILDLRHTRLTKLQKKHISNLKFLRYLDLSYSQVTKLPTLSKSPKLQVLRLHHCDKLEDLNMDLSQLTNLISLEVNYKSLKSQPSNIGKLINLRRLDVFVVGKSEGFKIAELSNLNDLKKSLCIKQLENVESKEEAVEAMLSSKCCLNKLELEWSSSKQNETAKQVLEGLQPPKNLRELTISNYCGTTGTEFPQWLNKSEVCGSLKSIHLKRCGGLPSLDQLQWLKTVRIEAMLHIDPDTDPRFSGVETLVLCNMLQLEQCIELGAKRMPCLLNLRVEKCQQMEKLPSLENLTSLTKLELIYCTELMELPKLPRSLKILMIENSDKLEKLCQVEGADLPELRGIEVKINSRLVPIRHISGGGSEQISTTEVRHRPSSSIQVVTGTTPADTSEPDPTSPNYLTTRIEIANRHQATSPNLGRAEFEEGGTEQDSTTGDHDHPSSSIQVVPGLTPANKSEPDLIAGNHASTEIVTTNGHLTTSPDLGCAELEEDGSERSSTTEVHDRPSSSIQLVTGSTPANTSEPDPTSPNHTRTKIEQTSNEYQATSPDLGSANLEGRRSEPDSTTGDHDHPGSGIGDMTDSTRVPTATVHPTQQVEGPITHQSVVARTSTGKISTNNGKTNSASGGSRPRLLRCFFCSS